jgi:hypothetical protein
VLLHHSTFDYLAPSEKQRSAMNEARAAAKVYAETLQRIIPDGADKTFILRAHRQNAMWVNVAITREADGAPRG